MNFVGGPNQLEFCIDVEKLAGKTKNADLNYKSSNNLVHVHICIR